MACAAVMSMMATSQVASAAQAVGVPLNLTTSGTSVNNSAGLTFTVSGTAQTPVTSNTATFVVDNIIDLTVVTTDITPGVAISPGSTADVLTFTVTNTGNTVQDYSLAATAGTGAFGVDNVDMLVVQVFVDSNNNGTYDSALDTATFIDELLPDTFETVFIVSNAPATLVSGDIASYDLTATTNDGGGAGLGAVATSTTNADAWVAGTVQNVFADAAGTIDAATDGTHSAASDYIVQSAIISVAKSVLVASDPVNGVTNPKAIPGAVVEYTIAISNAVAATASAILGTISDVMPADLTLNTVAAWTCASTTRAVTSGALVNETGGADSNADGIFATAPVGGTVTAALGTILVVDVANSYAAGELKAGETCSVTVQAVVN